MTPQRITAHRLGTTGLTYQTRLLRREREKDVFSLGSFKEVWHKHFLDINSVVHAGA